VTSISKGNAHAARGGKLSGRWRDVLVYILWVLVFTVLGWAVLLII
jgi:hypothetical protein